MVKSYNGDAPIRGKSGFKITLVFDKEDEDFIHKLAAKERRGVSTIVRRAVRWYRKEMEQETIG